MEGNETEVTVAHDKLNSGYLNFYTGDSDGSATDLVPYSGSDCGVNNKCSVKSLDYALADLKSNSVINITTDMTLFSIIPLFGLVNVSIIGHNQPTVSCNKFGGLYFLTCHNCAIEGIHWEECGADNVSYNMKSDAAPVLQLYNSSNITVKNCVFQHSVGQAVVLSGVSGDININYCNFLHNNQYKGHGMAIHYSSIFKLYSSYLLNLVISDCNFFSNEGTSILYLGRSFTKSYEHLYLQNSDFYLNKGVPIYLSNQNLYISGKMNLYKNVAENGGGIFIGNYSSVVFHQCAQILFDSNKANVNGGAMFLTNHSTILFKENSTVKFYYNEAESRAGNNGGGALYISMYSLVTFEGNSTVTFNGNTAYRYGGSVCISYSSSMTLAGNSNVKFTSNVAKSGGAVYVYQYSIIKCKGNAKIIFSDGMAEKNGGALYTEDRSVIVFDENSITIFNEDNGALDIGGAIFAYYANITFQGNSVATFDSNLADSSGGALHVSHSTVVIFKGNCTVTFSNNAIARNNGGALSVHHNSVITLEENSTVNFFANGADNGGAVYIDSYSDISFKGSSTVKFINNTADSGGALYIGKHSNIAFKENATVTIFSNAADKGGATYIFEISNLTFEGDCTVTFNENKASYGGAVYIQRNSTVIMDNYDRGWYMDRIGNTSNITFTGNSAVTFNNNAARSGDHLYIYQFCIITFEGNSTVTFTNSVEGGAVHIDSYSIVIFKGYSRVTFDHNKASDNGGSLYIDYYCYVVCKGNSIMIFTNNKAGNNGGALYISLSTIKFKEYFTMIFSDNIASINGGAMQIDYNSTVVVEENSMLICSNNIASNSGGAVNIDDFSNVMFKGNTSLTLHSNLAANTGGAMNVDYGSVVEFKENASVTFSYNKVVANGGALCIDHFSTFSLKDNSVMALSNNQGNDGGAVFIGFSSNLTFQDAITAKFIRNTGQNNGGAVHLFHAEFIILKGAPSIIFHSNVANKGGAFFTESSNTTFAGNLSIEFNNNAAKQDGGAFYLSDQSNFILTNNNSKFCYNTARDYGGAVYAQFKNTSITFNISRIDFKDNHAGTSRKPVYINVPKSCNRNCFFNRIGGVSRQASLTIATSPNKLILYDPAKCINGSSGECDTYYINDIMLGQEITFDACVMDNYDQPAETTPFSVTGLNQQHYNISSSKYISISCNYTTQGMQIVGNLSPNNSYNYTINMSLYAVRFSESKIISVNLMIELSQCHPGFWHRNGSQKCECYETKDIISCSNTSTTIKRGYWFGYVSGKPTVTSCPVNYCNFTCCEISNGIYHLWPVRTNQCGLHRTGPACGNCEDGYTLSYDSSECIEVDKCTVGQTILITGLSLLYWIAIVVAVLVMVYFKVSIGSIYGITYYYSVADILLSQDYYLSNALYTTINVMSSLAKLTPRFLGQLCLVRYMSGIDQQFIHYVHPAVVLLVLLMIRTLAKRSRKVSTFISRGIISFICFLLLLSYTSMANTSLLLMRSLTFVNVDKVYTYLSPDIEYFHGRHIGYVIVAAMLTIVIVISLPLLLSLEPLYLNSKFNFVKIKPLLDQFQESYKDKYRCFAAYYMICRIVIIVLFIARISDDFTNQCLLISVCALIALIHLIVRPYKKAIYNLYDGVILQLIVIVSFLPTVRYFDGDSNATFLVVITYLLITFPLVGFIIMHLLIHKKKIKNGSQKFINYCFKKIMQKCNAVPTDDMEVPINENGHNLENRTRRNVTCTVVKP